MTAEFSEDLTDNVVVEYEPAPDNQMHITITYTNGVLESGFWSMKTFGSPQLRGQLVNSVEEAAEHCDGLDSETVAHALEQWCKEMNEIDREEQEEKFLATDVRQIVEGTEHVHIHGGETTKWAVKLSFAGRTNELEFTASEWCSGGAKVLSEKVANQFYEVVEIEKGDWEAIRNRWQQDAEVVSVVEETASDAVAERVLEYLSNNAIVVDKKEDMGNDVAAVWFDKNNKTVYDGAPVDGNVVWVQDSFLVDQLEDAGKQVPYKSQLVQDLKERGDLYGGRVRRRWAWDSRTKVYPFTPSSVSITADDAGGSATPAHSEVDP